MIPVPLLVIGALASFAGNSLLCRFALRTEAIDPQSFTAIRLISGAAMLTVLFRVKNSIGFEKMLRTGSWSGATSLAAYALLFSFSYLRIDAGLGALILFSTVQFTMIGKGITESSVPTPREWLGLLVSVLGLAALTLPERSAPDTLGLLLMAGAGVAWGAYSLLGRRQGLSPIQSSAGNFCRAIPLGLLGFLFSGNLHINPVGALLAICSGAVTSGLGYALWYWALPHLKPTTAAIVQLAVPVLTALVASFLMGERLSLYQVAAMATVLSGVSMAMIKP